VEIDSLMPWVRFTQTFDWKPNEKTMISYRAGSIHLVKQIVADLAVREGKAIRIERPQKAQPCQPET
jgi:hypothetical protein